MPTKNTQFIVSKLRRQLREIKQFLIHEKTPITNWHTAVDMPHSSQAPNFEQFCWQQAELPLLWGGFHQTVWFKTAIETPGQMINHPIHLHVQFDSDYIEGLCYVNEKIVQGLDRNHQEICLTQRAKNKEHFTILIEAYSGRHQAKSRFSAATLFVPDNQLRDFYFTFKNALEVATHLPNNHPEKPALLETLYTFCKGIEWREPGSKLFRDSCIRAHRRISRIFQTKISEIEATISPVGHAHIDVAWLWDTEEVKRKCARTFATVTHLLDSNKDFHFVQSQPALYEFTREHYPELFQRIRKHINSGRWEPVGGMWVEADCNIPSGESLVRQVQYGKHYFREQFDVEIKTLWLPDVFGYSAALPQICKKAGIDYFFTAKIAWNDQNKFPYNTFHWQGIDGSTVLSHLTFLRNLYNSELTPKDVKEAWDRFKQKDTQNMLLLSYGFGDGGGGPTQTHIENARRLEDFPGLPRIEKFSVEEFFEELEQQNTDTPTWTGELYFEYHRGTLTTHAHIKKANRKAEFALRDAELFTVLGAFWGKQEAVYFTDLWKKLLLNQFHDILPGSSIPEVYAKAAKDYAEIQQACAASITKTQTELSTQAENCISVFNSLAWSREALLEINFEHPKERISFQDRDGNALPFQISKINKDQKTYLVQKQVQPLSGETITFSSENPGAKLTNTLKITEREMQNQWLKLSLSRSGHILSLIEKEDSREVVKRGAPANVLQTFEDAPAAYEAWDIDADFNQKTLHLFHCEEVHVLEKGPLRGCVEFVHRSELSTIRQRIFIYHNSRRIDFDTHIDWHEKRVLLKAAFPVNVLADKATFDIQFGNIERPVHRNTSWEKAKYEVSLHKWVDLSEGDYGVALLNDSKYGCDVEDNTIRLTLLRSVYPPDPLDPRNAVQYDHPTDQGEHHFVYSLLPHRGNWRVANVHKAAYEINVQPYVTMYRKYAQELAKPFLKIEKDNLAISAIKPTEAGDGVLVRLYEFTGQRGASQINFHRQPQKIICCDLLEQDICELDPISDGWFIEFDPYEIITLKLVF